MGATLLLVLIVTFVPWLGDTLFNTKGEPREALVAVTMLNSGDFILPESYGADIPYKPPFLAWLIAAASTLTGGIGEFASRLPSAAAVIAMALATFFFFARKTSDNVMALATALVSVTTIEVWRVGANCRVDMLLTFFTVTSVYALLWTEKPRLSAAAIVLMTCGVLTKGPVGMVLPCLIAGIYFLLRHRRFWPTFGLMTANGLLALIVPALWYWGAYNAGGDRFLRLALEENFGRFTGTMSYESHVNPWWYNVQTVAAGMLPYTLGALLSLFSLKRLRQKHMKRLSLRQRLDSMSAASLISLTAVATVFIFYCFPASKRSVYLLPLYPFLSWFMVLLGKRLIAVRSGVVGVYTAIIASVGLIVSFATVGFCLINAPAQSAALKGEALDLARTLYADGPGATGWILIATAAVTSGTALYFAARGKGERRAFAAIAATLTIYWLVSGVILPATLNPRSDKQLAEAIGRIDPTVSHTYTFNDIKMLRYYTAAFYLGDRLRLFAPEDGSSQSKETDTELPRAGFLVVNEHDMPLWKERYGAAYALDTLYRADRRSCDSGSPAMIVRFSRQ